MHMPRIARVVVPGIPHHVIKRGNRRQRVFFRQSDYKAYKSILARFCAREKVEIWAYCLMPNHVHFVMVPETKDGLRRCMGESHRRYTHIINTREGWTGFLWQGRFDSYPMDEPYLYNAVRYVELNPVKAGLCNSPQNWKWSSARAHLENSADNLVTLEPMMQRVPDWAEYLREGISKSLIELIERHGRTGRPLGSRSFLEHLEIVTGRKLLPQKTGPKPTLNPAEV